jgi:predicted Ser/Thr protein kinase
VRQNGPVSPLSVGEEFAGCRVEEVIGRGGMGVVYRGTELRLDRPVAIKLIATDRATDDSARRRFEREARLTAAIDHPNVIPVYGAGEQDGDLYLIMRYVDGTDLQRRLRSDGPLPVAEAARVTDQVARALDAAHRRGLVHRDIKPANVLLAGDHVYLTDFGITRLVDESTRATETGDWVGTVDFMSPEHLRGEETDARSDVYSLGCVLYASLTGVPPFKRASVAATITAHLRERPPAPSQVRPDLPRGFDQIVGRALAKNPAHRYASAGELGDAALAAAAGRPPRWGKGPRANAGPSETPTRLNLRPPGAATGATAATGVEAADPAGEELRSRIAQIAASTRGRSAEPSPTGPGAAAGKEKRPHDNFPSRGELEPAESADIASGEATSVTRVADPPDPAADAPAPAADPPAPAADPSAPAADPPAPAADPAAPAADPPAPAADPPATRVADPEPTQVAGADQVPTLRLSDQPAERQRRGPVLITAAALLVVVAAVVVLVALHSSKPTPLEPFTSAQVSAVVGEFADAYSGRNPAELRRVLAPNVTRLDPTHTEHGINAVLADYRSQFDTKPLPTGYSVSDLTVTGGWVGRASGTYKLALTGGTTLSGRVTFAVQRIGGRARIGLIVTQPQP